MSDDRPTARQLAAQTNSSDGNTPWECEKCGGRGWTVRNSYYCEDGTKHRRRVCIRCNHQITTYESLEKPTNKNGEDDDGNHRSSGGETLHLKYG